MKKMWLSLFLLCFSSRLHAGELPVNSLAWVSRCEGDLLQTKLIPWDSELLPMENSHCVLLENSALETMVFDPLGQLEEEYDSDSNPVTSKIFLLASLPPLKKKITYTLVLSIDEGVPECTECDGACFQTQEMRNQTIEREITSSSTGFSYLLLDIGEFIEDWRLTKIDMKATLNRDGRLVHTSTWSESGWPWCQ